MESLGPVPRPGQCWDAGCSFAVQILRGILQRRPSCPMALPTSAIRDAAWPDHAASPKPLKEPGVLDRLSLSAGQRLRFWWCSLSLSKQMVMPVPSMPKMCHRAPLVSSLKSLRNLSPASP